MVLNARQYNPSGPRKTGLKVATLLVVLLILLICSSYAMWRLRSTKTTTTVQNNRGTSTPTSHVPGGTDNNPTTGSGASKDEGDNQPGTPPATNVQPRTPTGQFVSNHLPNLSGKPYSNHENSVCTTTPGVLCEIRFTLGSTVKALPPQRTNENGDATWPDWTLQSIGLTEGSWRITAVAANGSKTATAEDVTNMEVKP